MIVRSGGEDNGKQMAHGSSAFATTARKLVVEGDHYYESSPLHQHEECKENISRNTVAMSLLVANENKLKYSSASQPQQSFCSLRRQEDGDDLRIAPLYQESSHLSSRPPCFSAPPATTKSKPQKKVGAAPEATISMAKAGGEGDVVVLFVVPLVEKIRGSL
jgi:hypothetical protein